MSPVEQAKRWCKPLTTAGVKHDGQGKELRIVYAKRSPYWLAWYSHEQWFFRVPDGNDWVCRPNTLPDAVALNLLKQALHLYRLDHADPLELLAYTEGL